MEVKGRKKEKERKWTGGGQGRHDNGRRGRKRRQSGEMKEQIWKERRVERKEKDTEDERR